MCLSIWPVEGGGLLVGVAVGAPVSVGAGVGVELGMVPPISRVGVGVTFGSSVGVAVEVACV